MKKVIERDEGSDESKKDRRTERGHTGLALEMAPPVVNHC